MRIKTSAEAECNITSMIDCLMQCIIFFMLIMSSHYIFGVAIKFSPPGSSQNKEISKEKPKNIVVYVQSDYIEKDHKLLRDGLLKLNGEEIPLGVSADTAEWAEQRKTGYTYLVWQIKKLIDEGYKKDVIMIQGDNKTYHGKIMKVVDCAKSIRILNGKMNIGGDGETVIGGFSLVPPEK